MKRKLTSEEKIQLVQRYYLGEAVTDICFETGIARSTFYTWLKPYQSTVTESGTVVNSHEFVKMKQHVAKLEQMIEVLQTVECTATAPLEKKLSVIEAMHGEYSVRVLCEALLVPRGTYYNHIYRNKRDNSTYQIRRAYLSEEIKRVFDESKQVYGARKITAVLKEEGIITSDKMVAELMREMNLRSIRNGAKKEYIFRNYTKKKDALKRNFMVEKPNQVWVSDTTRFNTVNKYFYICVILDLYARKVVGYKVSEKHSSQLIASTFKQAYKDRERPQGLTFHSDRGSQYTAFAFQQLLMKLDVDQSFSPPGKPHHNAVIESFFAQLKREELYRTDYRSVREFKKSVEDFMHSYNVKRPHSALGNKAPDTLESTFFASKKAQAS